MFRTQRFREPCSACDRAAKAACPRCGIALCRRHATAPYGCCEGCATDIYLAVSAAGKRALTRGGSVAIACTAAFYLLGPLLTPLLTGLLLLGIGGGLGVVIWSGLVSPRLADRRERKELTRPRELASAEPRAASAEVAELEPEP